jgi:PKHD-type hydroxylase
MTVRQDSIQRKLSIVLALSDKTDYEGGEFKLMPHGVNPNIFKFSKGDLIAFPSWVPHKVEPVTSGKRITLVAWACGPKFV